MGEGATHGIEENKVTRLEFVLVDNVADLALFTRCAWQKQADGILENDLNKSAAVQADT